MALEIIIQVLIVLAAAVLTGEVFAQFRLPSVAGELLSGMILGPTVLGLIGTNDQIQAVSSLALFFVIFLIGFEMNTDSLRKHLRHGIVLSLTAFVIPMFVVFGLVLLLFPFGPVPDLVSSLAIAVPSISIISVLVMQYGLLESEAGGIILASVAVADIVAFILLVAVSSPVTSTVSVIAYTAVFIAAFVAVDVVLSRQPRAFRRLLEKVGAVVRREEMPYAVLIVVGLLVAAIFQAIGLSYILGAFFAGLIVREGLIGKKAFQEVSVTFTRMNQGFFIPLFFGSAGLEADLMPSGYYLIPALAVVVGVTLVLSIATTAYAGRTILKLPPEEARRVAVTLGGRGAVGIVIASVALGAGVISGLDYSLVIAATLVISLVVPLLLGRKEVVRS
ncbi:MAG: cation:proton antiporter [Nitrososphaerales archaeon]